MLKGRLWAPGAEAFHWYHPTEDRPVDEDGDAHMKIAILSHMHHPIAAAHPLVPRDFEFIRTASPRVRIQQKDFLAEAVHYSIGIIHASELDDVVNNSPSSLQFNFVPDLAMMMILHTPPPLADITEITTDTAWVPGQRYA